jgi:TIR domain
LPAKGTKQDASFSAFISHAKADEKKAQAIADGLEARGFKCWTAPRDVRPGRTYSGEIIKGIENARSLILVLSSASNESAFVAREVERAVSKNKPVFPIRVENVLPGPYLELFVSSTQWIDAWSGRLSSHVARLAGLLTEEEGREPAPAIADRSGAKPRRIPRWAWPAGVGAAVLLAGAVVFWQARDPTWLERPKPPNQILTSGLATEGRATQPPPPATGQSTPQSSAGATSRSSITIEAICA